MDKNEETEYPVHINYNENDSSVSPFISHLIPAIRRKVTSSFYGFTLLLVIFSRDYAYSVSCLEKLVKALESSRSDENSYVVVPVFYGVSRLAVKQQLATFSDAFTEHRRSYPADQVTKWRRALKEAAEFLGHEYNDESSEESEFLEKIVEYVFEILYPTKEIGIYSRQMEIEDLLCKQAWGLRTLGIFGEPHIGKTVLARAVFGRMFGGYDATIFVKDFHTEFTEMRLEPLPSDFLCGTPMEKFDLNDSDSVPCHRQKRVLVVLDDVRIAQDAKSFLGAVDQFGPGSLIIITSRDKTVLEECQMNEIYELKGLNDEDALKLFTRCAFGNGVIEQNLLDLSMRVIKCSDGNPSSLISHAQELKGKTMIEMESMLLKICHDVQDRLKLFEGPPVHIVDACVDTMKNTSFCLISYENDYEHGVLVCHILIHLYVTGFCECPILTEQLAFFLILVLMCFQDTRYLSEKLHHSHVSESVPSALRDSHLDHDPAVQTLSLNPFFIYQEFACQFQKLKFWRWGRYYKSFSMLRRIKLGQLVTLVEVEEISEARQLEHIDLQDCTSLESILVTDKLERLQVLNLSGCNGIKRFPNIVRTIRELNLEGT
ncbi:hypothetical protein EUTSA_v10001191mg, partial [Eutrema salsugineum]